MEVIMNEEQQNENHKAVAVRPEPAPPAEPTRRPHTGPDPKQLRVEAVGKLLETAYQGASTLKMTRDEQKKLRADFPDEAIELRSNDGVIYISHMALRERLWEVFGAGQVAEICRERTIRNDSNEVAVDLVLMIRGIFVAEGIGTAKYYPQNPKESFGDTVEGAWSDALRRCCKKFGVGTQVWRPQYVRDWLEKYSQKGTHYDHKKGKDVPWWTKKPTGKGRTYELKRAYPSGAGPEGVPAEPDQVDIGGEIDPDWPDAPPHRKDAND
jgi:hypothetical protein